MAGIYIHVPFCKGKCAYCDFYSIVSPKYQDAYVDALCNEIEMQKHYLGSDGIQTIYFGGGTPSLLNTSQLSRVIHKLKKTFHIEVNHEITVEANPDDLNRDYLIAIKELGINRLSIGIQSFRDEDLIRMKRKHNAKQAIQSVKTAQELGFKNISIDLIYGLPDLKTDDWKNNISEAMMLNIQHISAYHLTIEPKTLFYKYQQNNKLNLPTENQSLDQLHVLMDEMAKNGFLHYEISNFAKDGSISLHNTNYWRGIKYLGLGPSAHSFNLTSRQWNISNLHAYLDGISKRKIPKEEEILSQTEKFNEYLMTSLRTMWGLNTEKIKKDFGELFYHHVINESKKFLKENWMIKSERNLKLTQSGIFISDHILENLLYD